MWVNGITFAPTAGAFTISGGAGATMTLGGTLLNLSSASDTFDANLNIVLTSTLNIGAFGNVAINGIISEATPGLGINKAGTGTLTLSGQNTYTGATALLGGVTTLDFANASAGRRQRASFRACRHSS